MNEMVPGGLEWNGMDNCYKKRRLRISPFRLWQFFFVQAMTISCSGYDNFFQAITIFFSGYDNSEMMSLEEEISHLHKENSHVIIMIMIMIYS